MTTWEEVGLNDLPTATYDLHSRYNDRLHCPGKHSSNLTIQPSLLYMIFPVSFIAHHLHSSIMEREMLQTPVFFLILPDS